MVPTADIGFLFDEQKENAIKTGVKAQPQGKHTGSIQRGPTRPEPKKNKQKRAKSLTNPLSYALAKRNSFLETRESGFTTKLAPEKREKTKSLFLKLILLCIKRTSELQIPEYKSAKIN